MNATGNARPDRIVVVDDDARIRDLLRRYLTQEGFEVLLAEDAKALTLEQKGVLGGAQLVRPEPNGGLG